MDERFEPELPSGSRHADTDTRLSVLIGTVIQRESARKVISVSRAGRDRGGGVGRVCSIWVQFFLDGMFPLSSCLNVLHLCPIPFELLPPQPLLLKSLFLYSCRIFVYLGGSLRHRTDVGSPTWPEQSDVSEEAL